MAEIQASKKPAQGTASLPEVTAFGVIKKIRYMVNSTPEFVEVLHGVNQMLGQVEDPEQNVSLQKSCHIDIVPLPHSESKFIISFMVPHDLLGGISKRRPTHIDFADYYKTEDKPQIIRKDHKTIFIYDIDSLFDLNLAFYDFQATLAPGIPSPQWSRVRRSIEVQTRPRQSESDKLKLLIIANAPPALQL